MVLRCRANNGYLQVDRLGIGGDPGCQKRAGVGAGSRYISEVVLYQQPNYELSPAICQM